MIDLDDFAGTIINTSRWVERWAIGEALIQNDGLAMGWSNGGVPGSNSAGVRTAKVYGPNTTVSIKIDPSSTFRGQIYLSLYRDAQNQVLFGCYHTDAYGDEKAWLGILSDGVTTDAFLSTSPNDGLPHKYSAKVYTASIELYLDDVLLGSRAINCLCGVDGSAKYSIGLVAQLDTESSNGLFTEYSSASGADGGGTTGQHLFAIRGETAEGAKDVVDTPVYSSDIQTAINVYLVEHPTNVVTFAKRMYWDVLV